MHLTGQLIVEMAELKQFRASEFASLKAFITIKEDKLRLPYGKRDITLKRSSVFIGTTNDDDYLTDITGN